MNNDTVASAAAFGFGAGLITEHWTAIIIGAVAVGIIQPFFKVLWEIVLSKYKTKPIKVKKKRKYKRRKRKLNNCK